MLIILLPQSNLESKSKSMSKSKRQGIAPNPMAVRVGGGYIYFVLPVNPSGSLIIKDLTRQLTRQPGVRESSAAED